MLNPYRLLPKELRFSDTRTNPWNLIKGDDMTTARDSKFSGSLAEVQQFYAKLRAIMFDATAKIYAAQIYASALGADEVRIMNLVDDRVRDYYCSYGYEFVRPRKTSLMPYCTIKVEV
jgi:hypothetical protein